MKLSRIAGLLAGVGILAGAQVALASDGIIDFAGEVNANTCDIDVNGGGSANASVLLPPVSGNALAVAGATAGWTPFDIALTNCMSDTAMVYFEPGSTVDITSGRLNNTGTSDNVQVALRLAGDAGDIIVGSPASSQGTPVAIDNGAATMRYEAGYWATDAVTAGSVATSVTYSLIYE